MLIGNIIEENNMCECLFCKIVDKKIPAEKVYEDNNFFAFLDINPAGKLKGHTLVVPKKHYETIFDINEKTLEELIIIVKKVSMAVKEVSGATGINILQNNHKSAGQLVNHLHFHIIPRIEEDGVYFETNRRKAREKELKETSKKILEKLK
jgi:histidine triad (HIT) family protein